MSARSLRAVPTAACTRKPNVEVALESVGRVDAARRFETQSLIDGPGRRQDAASDFAAWRRFGAVSAVRQQRFASIDGDLIDRVGPRLVEGAAGLCEAIDRAR